MVDVDNMKNIVINKIGESITIHFHQKEEKKYESLKKIYNII